MFGCYQHDLISHAVLQHDHPYRQHRPQISGRLLTQLSYAHCLGGGFSRHSKLRVLCLALLHLLDLDGDMGGGLENPVCPGQPHKSGTNNCAVISAGEIMFCMSALLSHQAAPPLAYLPLAREIDRFRYPACVA